MKRLLSLCYVLGNEIFLIYPLVPVGRRKHIGKVSLDLYSDERLIKVITDVQRDSHAVIEAVAVPQY